MNTAATLSPASEIASPWEQTRAFEWIFIVLGGLPLFLPLVLWAGEGTLARQDPVYWYYWMSAVFSAPHVYSTYVRLDRKIGERRVHWLMGIPGYLACLAVLAGSQRVHGFLVLMTGVNVWQTIHYARQGYGINRFFSRGSGEDALDRRLFYWSFHLALPLFVFGRWSMLYTAWRGIPSNVIIPVHFPDLFLGACWVLFFLGIALGLLGEARKLARAPRRYDPIGLATLVAYFAVHAYGFLCLSHYQRGFFAVTIYHGIQYMALVWMLEGQAVSRPGAPGAGTVMGASIGRLIRRFPFLLFWVAIFALSFFWERYLSVRGNALWPFFSITALSAVSAHHYLVDTVLWRAKAGK